MTDKYIRTNTGKIIKLSSINQSFRLDDVVAQSKNLIELIDVDDYVNGHQVISIDLENELIYCDTKGYETTIHNKDIKEILTKELYLENYYDVEQTK